MNAVVLTLSMDVYYVYSTSSCGFVMVWYRIRVANVFRPEKEPSVQAVHRLILLSQILAPKLIPKNVLFRPK